MQIFLANLIFIVIRFQSNTFIIFRLSQKIEIKEGIKMVAVKHSRGGGGF